MFFSSWKSPLFGTGFLAGVSCLFWSLSVSTRDSHVTPNNWVNLKIMEIKVSIKRGKSPKGGIGFPRGRG